MQTKEYPETNKIQLIGKISSLLGLSHEYYNQKFFAFELEIKRLSDFSDRLIICVPETLLDINQLTVGKKVYVEGQIRTYNKYDDSIKRNKLIIQVFAQEIVEVAESEEDLNYVYLDSYICKEPNYRKTLLGREITDLLLAVNRQYDKSDYIPSIAWERNARFSGVLDVGEHLIVEGRLQSREYSKTLENDEVETRIAYEVSISNLKIA